MRCTFNRGMLEFTLDPTLPYHNPVFSSGKKVVSYCASGGRSALAADTAQTMGLAQVSHLSGGFKGWKEANGPGGEDLGLGSNRQPPSPPSSALRGRSTTAAHSVRGMKEKKRRQLSPLFHYLSPLVAMVVPQRTLEPQTTLWALALVPQITEFPFTDEPQSTELPLIEVPHTTEVPHRTEPPHTTEDPCTSVTVPLLEL